MVSLRVFNRKVGFMLAAAALVVYSAVPAIVAAETVTQRSIAMSNSAVGAESVSYNVKFNTDASATSTGAFEIDFCTTAAVDTACTAPTGLDTTDVAVVSGATVTAVSTNGVKVVLDTPVTGGNQVDVALTGIDNTTTEGAFYARIVTYTDGATNYTYTDAQDLGNYLDSGTVALSTTLGFAVEGRVLESMTFCVSGATITDCNTTTSPDIALGTDGVLTDTLATGTVHTMISTNAVDGAVVNLKSDATDCGGLVRAGAATNADGCGISPLTTPGVIDTGDATFGLKLADLGATTGTVAADGSYDTTNFFMNYVDGNATGVTSPYGDPVYNTSDAPIDAGTADLTFGANKSSITPAGNYSATFSLIATGKF